MNLDIRELEAGYRREFLEVWKEAFGDEPEVYDSMEKCFKDEMQSFAGISEGQLVCELTTYLMGSLSSKKSVAKSVYASYAICTKKEHRKKGFGAAVTLFAGNLIKNKGGISVLSPASKKLEDFYFALGYRAAFYADEYWINEADANIGEYGVSGLDPERYGKIREKLLAGRTHVALSKRTMEWAARTSNGLYEVNVRINKEREPIKVSGILAAGEISGDGTLLIPELLVDTTQSSCGPAEAAAILAGCFAFKYMDREKVGKCRYRTPAYEGAGEGRYVQAMIFGDLQTGFLSGGELPYFGFTFE